MLVFCMKADTKVQEEDFNETLQPALFVYIKRTKESD